MTWTVEGEPEYSALRTNMWCLMGSGCECGVVGRRGGIYTYTLTHQGNFEAQQMMTKPCPALARPMETSSVCAQPMWPK